MCAWSPHHSSTEGSPFSYRLPRPFRHRRRPSLLLADVRPPPCMHPCSALACMHPPPPFLVPLRTACCPKPTHLLRAPRLIGGHPAPRPSFSQGICSHANSRTHAHADTATYPGGRVRRRRRRWNELESSHSVVRACRGRHTARRLPRSRLGHSHLRGARWRRGSSAGPCARPGCVCPS